MNAIMTMAVAPVINSTFETYFTHEAIRRGVPAQKIALLIRPGINVPGCTIFYNGVPINGTQPGIKDILKDPQKREKYGKAIEDALQEFLNDQDGEPQDFSILVSNRTGKPEYHLRKQKSIIGEVSLKELASYLKLTNN
jgi:hypothetical protein